jgi:hypothetical protein
MLKVTKKMLVITLIIAVCLGIFAFLRLREGLTPIQKAAKEAVERAKSRISTGPVVTPMPSPVVAPMPSPVVAPMPSPVTPPAPNTHTIGTYTPVSGMTTSGQQQQQQQQIAPPPVPTPTPAPSGPKKLFVVQAAINNIPMMLQQYISQNPSSPVLSQIQNLLTTSYPNLKQKMDDIYNSEPTTDSPINVLAIMSKIAPTPPYPQTDKLAMIGSTIEFEKLFLDGYITANPGTLLMSKLNDLKNSLTQFNQQLAAIRNRLPGAQQITTFIPWGR